MASRSRQREAASRSTVARRITTTAVVSWLSASTGWHLKQDTNLHRTRRVTPLLSLTDNGREKFIIVHPSTSNRVYRLHKP